MKKYTKTTNTSVCKSISNEQYCITHELGLVLTFFMVCMELILLRELL